MTLDRAFRLKTVAVGDLLIDTRGGIARLDKVYRLTPAAAWLWNKVQNVVFSEEDLVSWLCEEYDISHQQAREDIHCLLEDWIKNGIAS